MVDETASMTHANVLEVRVQRMTRRNSRPRRRMINELGREKMFKLSTTRAAGEDEDEASPDMTPIGSNPSPGSERKGRPEQGVRVVERAKLCNFAKPSTRCAVVAGFSFALIQRRE
jgi:hypothetical protein